MEAKQLFECCKYSCSALVLEDGDGASRALCRKNTGQKGRGNVFWSGEATTDSQLSPAPPGTHKAGFGDDS